MTKTKDCVDIDRATTLSDGGNNRSKILVISYRGLNEY